MKLTQIFSLGAAVVITIAGTSGCIKGVERLTGQTVDETKKINEALKVSNDGIMKTALQLEKTVDLTMFAQAHQNYANPELDANFRAAAAVVVVTKSLDANMLMVDVAAPFPLIYTHHMKMPNVTQVDERKDISVAAGLTMKPNTAKVLIIGCELAGASIQKSLASKLTALELEELHKSALNYFMGCSAAAGARPAARGGTWTELRAGSEIEKELKVAKEIIAKNMEQIVSTSLFSDAERTEVAAYVKIRIRGVDMKTLPDSPRNLPTLNTYIQ